MFASDHFLRREISFLLLRQWVAGLLLGVDSTITSHDSVEHVVMSLSGYHVNELLCGPNANEERGWPALCSSPRDMLGNISIVEPFAVAEPVACLGEAKARNDNGVKAACLDCCSSAQRWLAQLVRTKRLQCGKLTRGNFNHLKLFAVAGKERLRLVDVNDAGQKDALVVAESSRNNLFSLNLVVLHMQVVSDACSSAVLGDGV